MAVGGIPMCWASSRRKLVQRILGGRVFQADETAGANLVWALGIQGELQRPQGLEYFPSPSIYFACSLLHATIASDTEYITYVFIFCFRSLGCKLGK